VEREATPMDLLVHVRFLPAAALGCARQCKIEGEARRSQEVRIVVISHFQARAPKAVGRIHVTIAIVVSVVFVILAQSNAHLSAWDPLVVVHEHPRRPALPSTP
jgi:hypothetical protein